MEAVKIKYVGHACFKLTYHGTEIVLDPYEDGFVEEFAPVREDAHYVFCSHDHYDHNHVAAVSLHPVTAGTPFTVDQLEIPHDDAGGSKRGMNTIRIFTFGDIKIAHMGDAGRVLTQEEAARLAGLDCILIPVGGFYTIDAKEAKFIIEQTNPRVVVPMHYRSSDRGVADISTLEPFVAMMDNVNYGDSEVELSKDTPAQVLVLKQAALRA